MPESYTNLLYHLVFSTKDRRPLITPDYEVRLYDYIGGTVRKLGGISLALNDTADHVQLLAKLRSDRAVSVRTLIALNKKRSWDQACDCAILSHLAFKKSGGRPPS